MRPLELRLRNFRSYFGDEVRFDFRDRRLIGIVGPIGSGKSTILDAIAFALYGRTPRIARSTRSLIHQRADTAAVLLRFEVDGDVWEAVRSLRTRGQSQHALYRYETDAVEAEAVEKIVQEGEVNDRIAALLGFDYDAFGKSVLLAQGQFAEFLTARPADRDRVLKGVFGHDRIDAMRELAKQHAMAGEHEIDKLGIRLQDAERALARLVERRERLAEVEKRSGALAAEAAQVEALTERIGDATAMAERAQDRLDELARHAERMPDPDHSGQLLGQAADARSRREALAGRLESAHGAMQLAESRLKSESHLAQRATLAAAEGALIERQIQERDVELAAQQHAAAVRRHGDAVALVDAAKKRMAVAGEEGGTAEAALTTAVAAAEAAAGALHDAQHADMAASLRAELHDGDDCPVCRQPVAAVPPGGAGADLEAARAAAAHSAEERRAAERAVADATAESNAARTAVAEAERRVGELEEEVSALAVTRGEATDALTATDVHLAELVGAGDPRERTTALAAELETVAGEAESARRAWDEIRRQHDAAIAAEQESDRALGDLRTQLGALAALLDAEADLPEDDPAALSSALSALRAGWAEATRRLRDEETTARQAADAAGADLRNLLDSLGITGTYEAARAESAAALEMLKTEVVRDEQVVADSRELVEARQTEVARVERFQRLAADLTDAKFIRYLLDEERTTLAELGSDHFQMLSSGRYRFTDDGKFELIDLTAADSVRRADSLSGGETFLASLGLALGLAEMVGRTGGRLESFFLDEGFGSLDPEHLDLAMDGIERLVDDAHNRLVVVVSHVAEMRQRMEDLIVLDRDPTTGDSIVVAGAVT